MPKGSNSFSETARQRTAGATGGLDKSEEFGFILQPG